MVSMKQTFVLAPVLTDSGRTSISTDAMLVLPLVKLVPLLPLAACVRPVQSSSTTFVMVSAPIRLPNITQVTTRPVSQHVTMEHTCQFYSVNHATRRVPHVMEPLPTVRCAQMACIYKTRYVYLHVQQVTSQPQISCALIAAKIAVLD